ncbi:hypothetical protein VTI74DRAFT_9743 [Chaetomium olivicolor]
MLCNLSTELPGSRRKLEDPLCCDAMVRSRLTSCLVRLSKKSSHASGQEALPRLWLVYLGKLALRCGGRETVAPRHEFHPVDAPQSLKAFSLCCRRHFVLSNSAPGDTCCLCELVPTWLPCLGFDGSEAERFEVSGRVRGYTVSYLVVCDPRLSSTSALSPEQGTQLCSTIRHAEWGMHPHTPPQGGGGICPACLCEAWLNISRQQRSRADNNRRQRICRLTPARPMEFPIGQPKRA